MDAVLTIESEDAVRLAEQLAELTGEPVSVAVVRALAEQVARERRKRAADDLARELVEIGRRCAARLEPPFSSADHADLYGPDGLPA
jgi:antitoxin VapB